MSKTITLKTNVCCYGCRKRIATALRKIDGVEDVKFDTEENLVIVTGETDPAILVKKLKKLRKHAEVLDAGANNDENEEEKAPEENAPE